MNVVSGICLPVGSSSGNFLSIRIISLLYLMKVSLQQIRVHLQYTGHPIANDMLYMSEFVSSRAAEGLSADRAAAKSCSPPDPISRTSDMENDSNEDFSIDPMCTNCPNLAPKG